MTTDAASAVALDDPTTASTLGFERRRARQARSVLWGWAACAAVMPAVVLSLRAVPMSWRLVLLVGAELPLLALFAGSVRTLWAHRWLDVTERMFGERPWVPAPVRVLTWGRSAVLEISGLGCVRMVNRQICVRRTIDLTGRVDVIGPGPKGWVALRVPGVCTPLLARSTDPVPADPAPSRASAGSAADYVNGPYANDWRWSALWSLASYAVCAAFGLALIIVAVLTERDWAAHVVFGLIVLGRGFAALASYSSGLLALARMPARLAAAPWSAFPAWLDAWEAPAGCANARGLLHLPDGRALWFVLPGAEYDLLVTIVTSGVLHVAGTPEVGAMLPVGVPERPVLGYARFTAAGVQA